MSLGVISGWYENEIYSLLPIPVPSRPTLAQSYLEIRSPQPCFIVPGPLWPV